MTVQPPPPDIELQRKEQKKNEAMIRLIKKNKTTEKASNSK